jgi:hypothetical protein
MSNGTIYWSERWCGEKIGWESNQLTNNSFYLNPWTLFIWGQHRGQEFSEDNAATQVLIMTLIKKKPATEKTGSPHVRTLS